MTDGVKGLKRRTLRVAAVWLLVAGGGLLLAAANWQLVDIAIGSEPACVAHLQQGEGNAARGEFSAAESSCSSPASGAHGGGAARDARRSGS